MSTPTELSADEAHLLPDFDGTVATAREYLPIERATTKPEHWTGYTIVRELDRFAVFSSDAWTPPTQMPMLAWRPPTGTPVAVVDLFGTVHPTNCDRDPS